ncbi:hypothetical protein BCR42DRAFT_488737 [Absidia repens]|uniref:Rad4 transglutaminase-like domain-domain-containing protein n=1 Tax=Absidia repens TaxID=90262 RepID=A0A1X2IT64_9FUNG|nr:hypothetical protein BCR42DRAFT_488737 [Absidia repens]
MGKRKGKSLQNKNSNERDTEPSHSKRRRKQSVDNGIETSPAAIGEQLMTDTSVEMNGTGMDINDDGSDDDSIDWETVELPKWAPAVTTNQQRQTLGQDGGDADADHDHLVPHEQYNDVQIVFEAPRAVLKKSKWEMAYQRQLRDWMHNSHVVLLVGHFLIRNNWCSREDIKSVCLSVIPDYIASQNERKDESDQQFYTTIKWLMAWWHGYFKVTAPGMVTRPLEAFTSIPILDPQGNMIQELESHVQRLGIQDSEKIDDPTSFVNFLAEKEGSRDISAQLFTSLLRTLGFETRLVCSLQPIPFRIPATRTDKASSSSSSPTAMGTELKGGSTKISTRNTGAKNKSSLGTKTDNTQYQSNKAKPPTIWCEVWNNHQQKWICVDPIRQFYNNPNQMEPGVSNRQNILSFVLAFEEQQYGGGSVKSKKRQRIKRVVDVTRRYTTHLPKALVQRERDLTKRERQGGWRLWSELFLYGLQPTELSQLQQNNTGPSSPSSSVSRYNMEQVELEQTQQAQKMPTSIQGFHNHPLYVLERHLKKFEVLYHPTMDNNQMVIGHIRGENIYPRSCVQQIHTRESWIKQGRVVMDNQVPVKRILAHAVTLEKKRLQEEAKLQGDPLHANCFGHWQTTPYKAPPVIDGKIPKNNYGRVDLFTPDMLPEGGAHIQIDGVGKIAKQLGIDYAEALVDFEFVRGRSVPLVNGIIVAKENEFILLEAWREHEHHKANKAMAKQEKEVYDRWRKLIQGAMIDARIDNTYGKQQHLLLDTMNMDKHVERNTDAGYSGDNRNKHRTTNDTAWDRYLAQRRQQENTKDDDNNDDSDGFKHLLFD